MEVNEVERVVIAKPVATKPSCSSFRSFSELLAGAINASPSSSNDCPEGTVAAIRPKTVRVKPAVNRVPTGVLSSQGEVSGSTPHSSSDKASKPEMKSSVVYKPLAKVVSKATVTLLASMGNPSITHQQALAQVEARAQHVNQNKLHMPIQQISDQPPLQNSMDPAEIGHKSVEPPKKAVVDEPRPITSPANVDRPSYDGYNWRKYGQKQVKGSEYPRSYYKCTHPNCPVKKKVERSFDGQIAEIVYKGEHNHPKPQLPKRNPTGLQGQGLASDSGAGQDQDTNSNAKWNDRLSERNEGSEGHVEKHGEVGLPAQVNHAYKSQMLSLESGVSQVVNNVVAGSTADNSCGVSGDCEEGSKVLGEDDDHEDEPKSKRRKHDNQINETGTSGEGFQEALVSVQNKAEPDMQGDGFRWRKYGQKVVKGNPYPRSYYKCTSLKCNVRKHVERASDDPRAFITTYEGKHNHEMPLKSPTSSAASQQEPKYSSKDKS